MRLIGYWMESLQDESLPPPQELVSDYEPEVRERIAAYLNDGAEYVQKIGFSRCRFSCGYVTVPAELTDGEWVWPRELGHYVIQHNIRMPDEFIFRVLSGVKPNYDARTAEAPEANDTSFWEIWCKQHRSNAFKDRIEVARAIEDQEV